MGDDEPISGRTHSRDQEDSCTMKTNKPALKLPDTMDPNVARRRRET